MKKKLSYRDKLIELAYIYNVKEIQDYVKRRKNLTTGQIELILKKNKIIIPKEFKTSFFKENFVKPISKFTTYTILTILTHHLEGNNILCNNSSQDLEQMEYNSMYTILKKEIVQQLI